MRRIVACFLVAIPVGLLALMATVHAYQNPTSVSVPPVPPLPQSDPLVSENPPTNASRQPDRPPQLSADQLLDRLEDLKVKAEAIEREMHKTKDALQERLKVQKTRLKKVGFEETEEKGQDKANKKDLTPCPPPAPLVPLGLPLPTPVITD